MRRDAHRFVAGIPLSVRLIAATSLLVAAAVAAAAFTGQRAIEDLGRRDAATRRDDGERAIMRIAELQVQNVAAAVAVPLGTSAFGDVQPLLDAAVREDEARGDRRILWMVVADVAGQVVGRSGRAPEQTAPLPRDSVGVVREPIGAGTWRYTAPISLAGATIGTLSMGVTTAAVDAALAVSIREVEDRAAASTRTMWWIAAAVLAVAIAIAAVQGIGMSRPLRLLARHAERIAAGNFDERVAADRRDEIGALADSFNRMAGDLGAMVVERAQRAVVDRELSLARAVQQSMLPAPDLVRHGLLQIVGHCRPASTCGGDWWTFRPLSGDRLLIVVGDATGHGLHSAMIAATARGAVEALAEVDERLLSAEQVLRSIDAAIRNGGAHNVQMTCFAAVLDPSAGRVRYANAGQNFPYLLRSSDDGTLDKAEILALSGNPLGDRTIPARFRSGDIAFQPGDLFVCFTDGVVERQSPTGRAFGDRRLRRILHGSAIGADGKTLVELGDKVLAALEDFAGGTTADDDLTLVLCQFDPDARPHAHRRSA